MTSGGEGPIRWKWRALCTYSRQENDIENKQVEIGKLENQLTQWGEKLDAMTEKVTDAGAQAKAEERKVVAELRAKQELAKAKLDELKAAGGDKWETFKAGVESAYNELEATFKKLGN